VNGYIHIGDSIHQSGAGSIGKLQHHGSSNAAADVREMISLATELRERVGAVDRAVIDESAGVVRNCEHAEPGALRRAVGNLITVAAKAGQTGIPMLDAALKVKTLLGL
jgi:hypothetical protein